MNNQEFKALKTSIVSATLCEFRAEIYQTIVDSVGTQRALGIIRHAESKTKRSLSTVSLAALTE